MAKKLLTLVSTLAIVGMFLAPDASAKRVTGAGSMTFTRGDDSPSPLMDELVVTTVTSNPGLEKTIVQGPLAGPNYTLPYFVDTEKNGPGKGDLDAVVVMTNRTANDLSIKLILRDADGDELDGSPHTFNLHPYATVLVTLSTLIQ